MSISHTDEPTLSDIQKRLCLENIARCQAFKASPPPAPPQKDYKAQPLATPLPLPVKPDRRANAVALGFAPNTRVRSPEALQRRKEASWARAAAHQGEPVRMTSLKPPPNSSLVDE